MNPMGPIPDLFALNDEPAAHTEPPAQRTTWQHIRHAIARLIRRIRAALTKTDQHYPTDYSSGYRP